MNDIAPSLVVSTIPLDETYSPAQHTRLTTNFANLARGENRRDNLRNALSMIDNRFNALAHWDNPQGDRYRVQLGIVSVGLAMAADAEIFPLIELLNAEIVDRHTGRSMPGIVGNNFSSYVRDYDFSVLLPVHNEGKPEFEVPAEFGALHGRLFRKFVGSDAYRSRFGKPPVICLSVSSARIYRRVENVHPILGQEYRQDQPSLTDRYFSQMGQQVRYFMPSGAKSPLAFYFSGDLLNDYSNLELIGTIAMMETFQKIYRPEIYNANVAAGASFRPALDHHDYSLTRIVYDREERSRLAVEQGRFAEEHLIRPHAAMLDAWSRSDASETIETEACP